MSLVLASASPRRRELLNQIGVTDLIQHPVDIDETPQQGESAIDLVPRLALEKAQKGALELGDNHPVIGSDTVGVLNNEVLCKPVDYADAERMLLNMSGQWHEIHTSVALIYKGDQYQATSVSRVKFRDVSVEEIKEYWATGEPQDKAGAYAVQGLAAVFIERIEGSYSGIMGLPLFETAQLLKQAGYKI
ncbi:septum formation inhibitor Maf [Leucothrix sargassi]|nr:septum formation inhibitor Maf [Leucothrix sargassi]